jgi:hypothetical protein
MRRSDAIFILLTVACALLFTAVSLSQTSQVFSQWATSAPIPAGSAGQPRDVSTEQFRRLIEQRRLSGHEADFYRPLPEP